MFRLFAVLMCLVASVEPLSAAMRTAGTAKRNITPPVGTPMAGYYVARGAEGTHDPLFAHALVIESDGVKIALVSLDLITTTFTLVADSRKAIAEATGIPAERVMISATHSHTGPVLGDGLAYGDALGGNNALAKQYAAELPALIAETVKAADDSRKPAVISQSIGREDDLAFVRRFHMTDGSVGWNPGKKNPRILRPTAPTDPAVPIVVCADDKGKPFAVYVNFAMHLDTVGGLKYSADYPYFLRKALSDVYGDDLVTMFTTGCCGDINHINVNSTAPQKGTGEAARLGTRLAASVLKAWEKLEPIADGPIRFRQEMIDLELYPMTDTDRDAGKLVTAKLTAGAKPVPAFLDQVQAFRAADVAARLGKPLRVEVQVFSVGPDLAFVSLPGEVFVELGLAIKAHSPFKNTIVAELANGSVGYIPTRTAYPQGAYEVLSARMASGGGEKLVDAALGQLRFQFKAK